MLLLLLELLPRVFNLLKGLLISLGSLDDLIDVLLLAFVGFFLVGSDASFFYSVWFRNCFAPYRELGVSWHPVTGRQGDRLDHVCLLGMDARGNLDDTFLESLAIDRGPEGEYAITNPLPEERWPTPAFVKWGALRFAPRSKDTFGWFAKLGKRGLAVHGRDFYPLASKMTQNSKMVRFISDRLFEELVDGWGALRISNWDIWRGEDIWVAVLGGR